MCRAAICWRKFASPAGGVAENVARPDPYLDDMVTVRSGAGGGGVAGAAPAMTAPRPRPDVEAYCVGRSSIPWFPTAAGDTVDGGAFGDGMLQIKPPRRSLQARVTRLATQSPDGARRSGNRTRHPGMRRRPQVPACSVPASAGLAQYRRGISKPLRRWGDASCFEPDAQLSSLGTNSSRGFIVRSADVCATFMT